MESFSFPSKALEVIPIYNREGWRNGSDVFKNDSSCKLKPLIAVIVFFLLIIQKVYIRIIMCVVHYRLILI